MPNRPNVLWLMSDQHNAHSTGYAGDPNAQTPHLDALAESGVNFRQAFTVNPICSPSRLSAITGQYCHTHGLFGNFNVLYPHPNPDTLACVFRRAGYQTAIFGKSHMIKRWDDDGFEHIRYDNLGDVGDGDPMSCEYFRQFVESGQAELMDREMHDHSGGPEASFMPYELSCEHFTGAEAVKFLESRDRERPFFAQVSFQRPHGCNYAAKEYFDRFKPEEIILPESAVDLFENKFASKPAPMRDAVLAGSGYPLSATRERLKQCLCGYYALLAMIDNEIGEILSAVEAAGDLDNTIVLYTADHGDYAGDHGLMFKGMGLYESIHHIPMLLRWPGGPAGAACDELVENIDWYPTVCGLCGIDVPPGRDGRDVVPVALGHSPGKDAVFCEYALNRKLSAIRTKQYRLVIDADGGCRELYHVQSDPGELCNVYDDPTHASARADLTERLLLETMDYRTVTSYATDAVEGERLMQTPAWPMHFGQQRWSDYAQKGRNP